MQASACNDGGLRYALSTILFLFVGVVLSGLTHLGVLERRTRAENPASSLHDITIVLLIDTSAEIFGSKVELELEVVQSASSFVRCVRLSHYNSGNAWTRPLNMALPCLTASCSTVVILVNAAFFEIPAHTLCRSTHLPPSKHHRSPLLTRRRYMAGGADSCAAALTARARLPLPTKLGRQPVD